MRALPAALLKEGWRATVATPSYGTLHKLPGAVQLGIIAIDFRNASHEVEVWRVPGSTGVENIVFHHTLFAAYGPGCIYCSDTPDRPFAADASKFAFFCAVAAGWLLSLEQRPEVVHLHDWHAAFYLLLSNYSTRHAALREVRTVFTIHNVSYQGTRPLAGDDSSLKAWFPALEPDLVAVADPVHRHCINPMATAIRLADRLSTVSPTYAQEICRPSDPESGFIGGEGLEHNLKAARAAGRLVGILNGCTYDPPVGRRPGWQRLLGLIETQLRDWRAQHPQQESHALALQRIATLPKKRPGHVLTSVGRLVAQKATLLLHAGDDGGAPLAHICDGLGRDGVVIVLGSGEATFEQQLLEVARRVPNLVFLQGYSETLADPLYRAGDLFLMPSSFEPCGISQMLAMRYGQPCVVHAVGGLQDTVTDGVTGFSFAGATVTAQAGAFIATTRRALALRTNDPARWREIRQNAAALRFEWSTTAQQTIRKLYGGRDD